MVSLAVIPSTQPTGSPPPNLDQTIWTMHRLLAHRTTKFPAGRLQDSLLLPGGQPSSQPSAQPSGEPSKALVTAKRRAKRKGILQPSSAFRSTGVRSRRRWTGPAQPTMPTGQPSSMPPLSRLQTFFLFQVNLPMPSSGRRTVNHDA